MTMSLSSLGNSVNLGKDASQLSLSVWTLDSDIEPKVEFRDAGNILAGRITRILDVTQIE